MAVEVGEIPEHRYRYGLKLGMFAKFTILTRGGDRTTTCLQG
jgi:hypothetical protein